MAVTAAVDRLRLPLEFDPGRLSACLDAFTDGEWIDHFVPENYDGCWSAIPLRSPAGETHPIRMIYSDPTCEEFVDTPFLSRSPYLAEVLKSIPCPKKAARLMKLGPGSEILEHRDHDLHVELGNARLHVPISTSSHVHFTLNDEPVNLAAGECWYLRLSDPHRVVNEGSEDRVHLVVDVETTPWLTDLTRG